MEIATGQLKIQPVWRDQVTERNLFYLGLEKKKPILKDFCVTAKVRFWNQEKTSSRGYQCKMFGERRILKGKRGLSQKPCKNKVWLNESIVTNNLIKLISV